MTTANSTSAGDQAPNPWQAMKTPAGFAQKVLYLDFDGVLMPERVYWHPRKGVFIKDPGEHKLFEHAPLLEQLLEPYPSIRIVLSTSWVVRYGYSRAADNLPPGLRSRVIGGTYHSAMDTYLFREAPRGMQVWSDVLRRRPRDWLALDDDYLHWPAWCRDKLVRTSEEDGIADPAVRRELEAKLATLGDSRSPSG